MPPTIRLRKDKKDFREKVLTTLNDVLDFYGNISSNLKHKGNLVNLQVKT